MDIKKVIKDSGWTLERLAAEMTNKNGQKGISQPSVSQIVNGNPTLDKLQEIAGIIGISVSELVMDKNNEDSNTITCPHCGKKIKIEKGE
jgi:transcriptional regulator with XRE-family HTH domain